MAQSALAFELEMMSLDEVEAARRRQELASQQALPTLEIAPEWEDPEGVPISAIMFGGRRASNVPLITQARDWEHGVFLGSIMSSEKTAAAAGKIGEVRFDPFAMLPFMGYNVGDYIKHWIEIGKDTDSNKLPKLFWPLFLGSVISKHKDTAAVQG